MPSCCILTWEKPTDNSSGYKAIKWLINPTTLTAKLKDIVLSKLKLVCVSTTKYASSVASTVMYMATGGLLQRKTYVQTDICSWMHYLELITKEVWNIFKGVDPSEFLTKQTKLFKLQHRTMLYITIDLCLNETEIIYDSLKRPSAFQHIELFYSENSC